LAAQSAARQAAGLAAFNAYYEQQYGERWKTLLPALRRPMRIAAVMNRFAGPANLARVRTLLQQQGAQPYRSSSGTRTGDIECWLFPAEEGTTVADPSSELLLRASAIDEEAVETAASRFPPPASLLPLLDPQTSLCWSSSEAHGQPVAPLPYYPMDFASVLAVEALGLQGHERVLDLCAAPGGKSICMAQKLRLDEAALRPLSNAEDSPGPSLECNDVSGPRRKRLLRTLRSYLPARIANDRTFVRVEGVDVTAMRVQPAQFDAVLVDAPCSTDRHTLLASPTELEHWTPGRFRRDAQRQIALLLQALRLVRVGGTVLYATCSLSNAENDAVIAAVRAQCDKWKQKGRSSEQGVQLDFAVEPIGLADSSMPTAESTVSSPVLAPLPIGEPTAFGWMVLPDQPEPVGSTVAADGIAGTPHAFGPLYMSKLRRLA
jgi:hypothetical protein